MTQETEAGAGTDETPEQRLWAHVTPDAVARLRDVERDISAVHATLRKQLRILRGALTAGETLDERRVARLLVVLDHTTHLTRESIRLNEERRALLKW
jgi:hypothetical protein